MHLARNVGVVDANVRRFLALPFLVLAATGSLAYHAYGFALAMLALAALAFASGQARFCPVYAALGLASDGGLHRVRRADG